MTLRKELEAISNEMNNKDLAYTINRGGCGLFAALIAEKFNLKESIYAQYYGDISPNKVGFLDSVTQHLLIKLDGEFYDCSGFKNPQHLSGCKVKVSFDLLLNELENVDIWYRDFTYSGIVDTMNGIINRTL